MLTSDQIERTLAIRKKQIISRLIYYYYSTNDTIKKQSRQQLEDMAEAETSKSGAGSGAASGSGAEKEKQDTLDFDEEEVEEDAPLEKRKKMFSKELRCMMYGFGDDQNPYTESVDLLEDLVIEYITEMTKKAMEVGRPGRIAVEDIIFLIRKDPKKYSRVKELLIMNEELRKARKAFDEIKYATTK